MRILHQSMSLDYDVKKITFTPQHHYPIKDAAPKADVNKNIVSKESMNKQTKLSLKHKRKKKHDLERKCELEHCVQH